MRLVDGSLELWVLKKSLQCKGCCTRHAWVFKQFRTHCFRDVYVSNCSDLQHINETSGWRFRV